MFGENKQLEDALSNINLGTDQAWWPELETLLRMKMPEYRFEFFEDSENNYLGMNDAADLADFIISKRHAADIQVCIWQSTDGELTYLVVAIKEI